MLFSRDLLLGRSESRANLRLVRQPAGSQRRELTTFSLYFGQTKE